MARLFFWFDNETTGKDPKKDEILKLYGEITSQGTISAPIDIGIRPSDINKVDPKALAVNRITAADMYNFGSKQKAYHDLRKFFKEHIPVGERAIPAGYNVKFDLDFLSSFIYKQQYEMRTDMRYSMYDYLTKHFLDVYQLIVSLHSLGILEETLGIDNFKLSTVCERFEIVYESHVAKNDIWATRELLKKIYNKYLKKDRSWK